MSGQFYANYQDYEERYVMEGHLKGMVSEDVGTSRGLLQRLLSFELSLMESMASKVQS